MIMYKVRVFGMGIDAKAVIPFHREPTTQEVENAVVLYLNENLYFNIEADKFYDKNKYTITYEEIN